MKLFFSSFVKNIKMYKEITYYTAIINAGCWSPTLMYYTSDHLIKIYIKDIALDAEMFHII